MSGKPDVQIRADPTGRSRQFVSATFRSSFGVPWTRFPLFPSTITTFPKRGAADHAAPCSDPHDSARYSIDSSFKIFLGKSIAGTSITLHYTNGPPNLPCIHFASALAHLKREEGAYSVVAHLVSDGSLLSTGFDGWPLSPALDLPPKLFRRFVFYLQGFAQVPLSCSPCTPHLDHEIYSQCQQAAHSVRGVSLCWRLEDEHLFWRSRPSRLRASSAGSDCGPVLKQRHVHSYHRGPCLYVSRRAIALRTLYCDSLSEAHACRITFLHRARVLVFVLLRDRHRRRRQRRRRQVTKRIRAVSQFCLVSCSRNAVYFWNQKRIALSVLVRGGIVFIDPLLSVF